MEKVSGRKRTIAAVLAILGGDFGLHRFYLGEWKKGILCVLFFWTGVPKLLGLLDGARLLTRADHPDAEK